MACLEISPHLEEVGHASDGWRCAGRLPRSADQVDPGVHRRPTTLGIQMAIGGHIRMAARGQIRLVRRQTSTASERELHTLVGCGEADRLVEPPCVGSALVRRQLHHRAVVQPGLFECPVDHCHADSRATTRRSYSYTFDLGALRSAMCHRRDDAELHGADDGAAYDSDDQELSGVAVDLVERPSVCCQVGVVLPTAAELVVLQEPMSAMSITRARLNSTPSAFIARPPAPLRAEPV